jgi:chromosome segregation ATPase
VSEHDAEADRLEEEADDLERRNEQLGERIDEVRKDWESKQHDESVPGAVEDEDEPSEGPPPEADITPGD